MPNTEVPLPLCYCLDVTASAERKSFPPPDKTGDFVYDLILKSLGYHSCNHTRRLKSAGRLHCSQPHALRASFPFADA